MLCHCRHISWWTKTRDLSLAAFVHPPAILYITSPLSVSLVTGCKPHTSRLCSNGARSPEATNIWLRATENIFLVARPGDLLVLVS